MGWRNKALLLQWCWRFGFENSGLWKNVLCARYGFQEGLMLWHLLLDSLTGFYVYVQDILKFLLEDNVMSKAFHDHCFCKLGHGISIRLWTDPWVELGPLYLRFPRTFALASDKTITIQEVGSFEARRWVWNIPFRRRCFDWESAIEREFMS